MDTQVFNIDSLIKTLEYHDPLDKEHVTRYIVNNQIYSHFYLIAPPSLYWPIRVNCR